MGHASLPEAERHVEVRLYVATLKGGAPTADELLVERLRADLGSYGPELKALQAKAVDAGMWQREDAVEEEEGEEAAAALAAAAAALHAEEQLSESDDDEGGAAEEEEVEVRPCHGGAWSGGPY